MDVITNKKPSLFFVYGCGGTGKTYLYRTLLAVVRSKKKIAFAVTLSGIASLLLLGGRIAHSRFKIPINITKTSVCDIKPSTQAAELMLTTELIIWDEAPMTHRYYFEAVDRTLKDLTHHMDSKNEHCPFGGKFVVLGGDFHQILPIVHKGKREEIVVAVLNKPYL